MSHDDTDDLVPPASPHMVEAVLQGPAHEVALIRQWIEFRSVEVRSSIVDLPDGTVRCRMYVIAERE
ncbi:hypothetical protein ACFW3D_29795 [Streptomyces sp. NPDC058864]